MLAPVSSMMTKLTTIHVQNLLSIFAIAEGAYQG